MNETTFREFPKIARLSRDCIVTEKIDGTNASITITDDGQFLTGSRTRFITPTDDNFGFSRWAHEHKDELLTLGVGTHFGEWWGGKIQRGYGLTERRFSLFNVQRFCLHGTKPDQIPTSDPRIVKMQQVLPPSVGLVPVLDYGHFDTQLILDVFDALAESGSKAAPGFMQPEGIVVFHIAGNVGFKKTFGSDGAKGVQ